jgi:hypothetical protein
MWQCCNIWEEYDQINVVCMKKLRADKIQGMSAAIQ